MSTSKARGPDVKAARLIGGSEALDIGLHRHDARRAGDNVDHRLRVVDVLAAVHVEVERLGSPSVPAEAVTRSLIRRPWNDMNDDADAKSDVILAIEARAQTVHR